MAVDPDKPFNREEMYLAKAAGEGTTVPDEPWSRKEAYLDKISGRLDGIDAKIAALATDISLKGGVEDYDHLPTDAAIGDAYITEDTGILYVWVGDEWTPLNMQGGGGVKELTTSDYNYPVNNPTSVAIWLLDEGYYQAPADVSVSRDRTHTVNTGTVFMISHANNTNNKSFILTEDARIRCGDIDNNGYTNALSMTNDPGYLLDSGNVVDSVTSSTAEYGTSKPLSAKQGYLLNKNAIGTTESKTIATTGWTALASSDPYTYSATVVVTTTISNSSIVELINDQAVLFGTYGFAIGSVSGQNVTIYSIGQPDASVTLKVNVKG